MVKLVRGKHGKFAAKSDEYREVRSLRLTPKAWDALGSIAEMQSITRADLIEKLAECGQILPSHQGVSLHQIEDAIGKIVEDPQITRNGKDRGAVKRALEALLHCLS